MRVPDGGASCLGVGRPGSGALPPSTARPLNGLPGPTTHLLWVRGGAGVGTPHQPHSARSCKLALRAVGAARGRPGGGASCLSLGRRRSGSLPPPTARPLSGLPGPATDWLWVRGGAGVATRHQPHSARFCVLWGRHEGARGGRLLPGCGASGVRRSPSPNCPPSGRAAGAHYSLAVGAGGAGVGTRHQPHSTRSCELALRAVVAARGRPGGAPLAWVWGVRGRALSHPRLPALWAGCRGPPPTGCGRGGVRAWGPVTNPTARAPASWLCVLWGRHEGARGGRRLPGCGASGVGRSRTPTACPLGGLPGPTTHWLWVRGGAGVGTRHPPHSARSCVLWGRHEGARGRRSLPGCGESGVWRSSTPDCPPSRRAAGAHYPLAVGAGGCGRGDPSPTTLHALLRAGFARCGGGMRMPGGAPLAWLWGVRGRALSQPQLPALLAGFRRPLPTGCKCGGVRAWGPVTNPTARALACCGGGMRVPGRAPLAWVWGVQGRALSDARLPALWAGCRGPLPAGCGCGGMRAWGPVTIPTARASASWLCALWGRHEGARGGGASCLGVGRRGSGSLPPPTARPLGGLPGPATDWPWVRGARGRWDPSPTPQRALLRAVGAA